MNSSNPYRVPSEQIEGRDWIIEIFLKGRTDKIWWEEKSLIRPQYDKDIIDAFCGGRYFIVLDTKKGCKIMLNIGEIQCCIIK